ncbi:MAG: SirB2 family protein [Pseudomonadales bacterium]|nr:SirB2 family protein [Pseudomonadales bacterium]
MLIEYYPTIRLIHVSSIILSISFFMIRGCWMWFTPVRLEAKWVKVTPQIIDTVLLVSGITLILLTQQYPHQQAWLLTKLGALVAYIGFGMMALTYGRTKWIRLVFLILAISAFAYIVSIALTKSATPWIMNHPYADSTASSFGLAY